ncbi:MAG: T9SS type A sorting domain-containing protein [Bacteroidetes bacterium]|nr:T9SS type A sorting domain-containing protein [Bacteroidota bacterium]
MRKSFLFLAVVFFLSIFFSITATAQKFYISPNGKAVICSNDSLKLEAASGYAKYVWSTGNTTRFEVAKKGGWYYCIAADAKGNIYADSIYITSLTPKTLKVSTIPSSASICAGDSMVIEVNMGFKSYAWNNGSKDRRLVIRPTANGYLKLEVVDSNGCQQNYVVTYSVKNCSAGCVGILQGHPDLNLCGTNDSVRFEVKNGYKSYVWSDGSTGRLKTAKTKGWYKVTVTDSAGNTCSDSLEVKQEVLPQTIYSNHGTTICKGDSLELHISTDNDSIWWSSGAKATKVIHVAPSQSTKYVVYTRNDYFCYSSGAIEITVKDTCNGCKGIIQAYPDANICGNKDSVRIEVKSGYHSYVWADGATGRLRTIYHSGWYVVTVTDNSGKTCKDSVQITQGVNVLKVYTYPSSVICLGDTVTAYIAAGYDSVWWDNTHYVNTNVAKYKPTSTAVYHVYAKDSNGCYWRGEFKIEVKDSCNKCSNLIGYQKKVLCGDHDTVILEAKSGFKKYLWSNKSDNRIQKITKTGWYYLIAMTADSSFCYDSIKIESGGKSISISANPSSATVCKGDSLALEATWGFKSYDWNIDGVQHANGIKYLPKESKKVVVYGVLENGCKSVADLNITVKDCNHCPKIIEPWPSTSLCGRDSIILEAKNGYKSYKWKNGKEGRLLTVKETGWYWIDFKDSSGNECRDSVYISNSSPKELKIRVNPDGKICVGDTLKISASEGFKSYAWNTGKKDRTFMMKAERSKELVVEATDSNGCSARTTLKLVVDSCNSSVNELKFIPVKVYPNPASNLITLETSLRFSEIMIVDQTGRTVLKTTDGSGIISINHLAEGTYMMMVKTEVGIYRTPVIISR